MAIIVPKPIPPIIPMPPELRLAGLQFHQALEAALSSEAVAPAPGLETTPRVSIAETRTKGTPWTDGWHHVRLVRNVKDGLIQVFFDDMNQPAMTAHDRTFDHGRIGV